MYMSSKLGPGMGSRSSLCKLGCAAHIHVFSLGDIICWWLLMHDKFANPPAPYSMQKCPEPEICPKFVRTIVFRDSNQGDPNLSKNCEILKLCQFPDKFQIFDKFLANFWQIWVPLIGIPKNNRRDKFWTNLGFCFECCMGREGSQC